MADRTLSDYERLYITEGIKEDLRADGRSCRDYRHFELKTGVVSNTSGSAEIRLDRTAITVGVKAEIGVPHPSSPSHGRIEFFVDCSALASPKFQGREGYDLGQYLGQRLSELYSTSRSIDLESLCIIPGQQCWILYVDSLVLEWSGGVLDCLCIAIKAALANTRIPKLQVIGDGEEMEIEVSDNPFDSTHINTTDVPIIVTLSSIGGHFVVDASHEEESCSTSQVSIAVNTNGFICGIIKEGISSIPLNKYSQMLTLATDVGKSVLNRIDSVITNSREKIVM